MSDWYCSSAAYAAISVFVASHSYSIGDIVKPTAAALKAQWVFRCTTAGTSSTEPAWPTGNNATVVSGGATFTNVTGQSAFGWGAAAGDMPTLQGAVGTVRFIAGDRIFVSSDHAETQTTTVTYGGTGATSYTVGQILCVNRAGSVPPVTADLTVGATVTVGTGAIILTLEANFPVYHYGISYIYTGTSVAGISFGSTGSKTNYFDNCQLYLNTATATVRFSSAASATVVLANSTLRFGAAAQAFAGGSAGTLLELLWLNTLSAIAGATIPTILFAPNGATSLSVTARGVDLSAITGTLLQNPGAGNLGSKFLFDSCRIATGVTRSSTTNVTNTRDLVEMVNCYDGTSILNESYQPAGAVTTERTITLSGGATDDVGVFSHKLVSGTNVDKYVNPLIGFWMDVENTAIGSSKTATVEIISSLTLNNDDISLLLEYQGTTGSSLASFANTLPTNVLTANAAVATSTAIWNSSPATPVKQKLVVTFTPQVAGRVRGQVRLGRASTTAYINPLITIA
jgi:hypothetical protein